MVNSTHSTSPIARFLSRATPAAPAFVYATAKAEIVRPAPRPTTLSLLEVQFLPPKLVAPPPPITTATLVVGGAFGPGLAKSLFPKWEHIPTTVLVEYYARAQELEEAAETAEKKALAHRGEPGPSQKKRVAWARSRRTLAYLAIVQAIELRGEQGEVFHLTAIAMTKMLFGKDFLNPVDTYAKTRFPVIDDLKFRRRRFRNPAY